MRIRRVNSRVHRSKRSAFTLLEILIVVSIIVVLASTGYYYFHGRGEEAKLDITKAKIEALTSACEQYHARYNEWPASFEALANPPGGVPYIKGAKALTDGWGQLLQYDPSGSQYNNGGQPDIWCVHGGKVLWHNGPDPESR